MGNFIFRWIMLRQHGMKYSEGLDRMHRSDGNTRSRSRCVRFA